jgi:hypothetical protein
MAVWLTAAKVKELLFESEWLLGLQAGGKFVGMVAAHTRRVAGLSAASPPGAPGPPAAGFVLLSLPQAGFLFHACFCTFGI